MISYRSDWLVEGRRCRFPEFSKQSQPDHSQHTIIRKHTQMSMYELTNIISLRFHAIVHWY
jgi:hypothetical protein